MSTPTTVYPTPVAQLARIEELRDTLYNRLCAARAELDEAIANLDLGLNPAYRENVEIANSIELDLLRTLVNSTRPCPLALTK